MVYANNRLEQRISEAYRYYAIYCQCTLQVRAKKKKLQVGFQFDGTSTRTRTVTETLESKIHRIEEQLLRMLSLTLYKLQVNNIKEAYSGIPAPFATFTLPLEYQWHFQSVIVTQKWQLFALAENIRPRHPWCFPHDLLHSQLLPVLRPMTFIGLRLTGHNYKSSNVLHISSKTEFCTDR